MSKNLCERPLSGSFVTREEDLALAKTIRAGDQAHTALVEGNLRYVISIAKTLLPDFNTC